jgi:hypothetical protein
VVRLKFKIEFIWLILALAVCLCSPTRAETPSSSTEITQSEFNQLLRHQTEANLREISERVPRAKRAAFSSAVRRGLAVFKERFDLAGFLNHYGKLVSIVYPVMFVVDNLIIGALFAIGEPALATAYLLFPGTSVETGIAVAVAGQIDRFRVMRDLNILHRPWQIWSFAKKRREILGSNETNHLLATIRLEQDQAATELLPVRVLRNQPLGVHAETRAFITRKELEKIVDSTQVGRDFLKSLIPLIQQRQQHVALLINYVQSNPEMHNLLNTKIAQRTESGAISPLHDRLFQLQEERSRVTQLHQTLDREIAHHNLSLERRLFRFIRGRLTDSDKQLISFILRMRERMNAVELALWRDEMAALYEASMGREPPARFFPNEATWNPADRIAAYHRKIEMISGFINEAHAIRNAQDSQAAIEALLHREEEVYQLATTNLATPRIPRANVNPREECLALFQRLNLY